MDPAAIQRMKKLLPTSLGSEEIRDQIAADILRRSVFSARMASVPYLQKLRTVLAGVSGGTVNQADARNILEEMLEQMGHSPADGGGIANPASIKRLNLIVDTNRQMAASVASIARQDEDTVDQFPGWELLRYVGKRSPRKDWAERWAAAGNAVNWEGAARHTGTFPEWSFIALKSSPIWAALGNGAGGYRDTLGNPYPPFAYGSGLAWDDVERERCEALGLLKPGEQAKLPKIDFGTGAAIADAEARTGFSVGEGLE